MRAGTVSVRSGNPICSNTARLASCKRPWKSIKRVISAFKRNSSFPSTPPICINDTTSLIILLSNYSPPPFTLPWALAPPQGLEQADCPCPSKSHHGSSSLAIFATYLWPQSSCGLLLCPREAAPPAPLHLLQADDVACEASRGRLPDFTLCTHQESQGVCSALSTVSNTESQASQKRGYKMRVIFFFCIDFNFTEYAVGI